MRFQPKTAEEVSASKPFEKGIYDAEIQSDAEATVSKTGKDMIKLRIKVFSHDGSKSQTIYDYLMGDAMEFKLRHACESAGLLESYEKGEIEPFEFEGKSVRVKLGIQAKTDQYPERNTIIDYVVDDIQSIKKAETSLKDDGIVF